MSTVRRKYIASFICFLFLACMVLLPFQNCAQDEDGSGVVQYGSLSGQEPYIDHTSGDELVYHPGQSVVLNVHRVYGVSPRFSWFFVEKLPGGRVIDRPAPAQYIKVNGVSFRFALTDRHLPNIERIEEEQHIYIAVVAANEYGSDRYEFEVLVRPHGSMALRPVYCSSPRVASRGRDFEGCQELDEYQNYNSELIVQRGQNLWLRGASRYPIGGRYSWYKRESNDHQWVRLKHQEPVYRVFSSPYDWSCRKSRQHQYRLSARRDGSDDIDEVVFKVICP